ncbi:DEAD/DEAH box helicase [Shewanella intestini]|uniref:ATP-dependent RNA helicase RhlE n=1 Tax=Shewanella intestini TaxID=2017544 RepID=A0ABS5I551_9GAMM|nr:MULTISPECIES: DEAD/DEAH box helicase [Shewanella]MBR9729146.1 DEAD/DEAH box helicase [Shewanella intestini]MRG37283.1 DEAD/DEAH box helicase [Shewanella sp. XMDDZSB0408]
MSFASLGLQPAILQAVEKQGYTTPSPIQAQAIPAILKQQDVMAAAQTGTGKTAGFTLPILELLSKGKRARNKQVRALVLTPTRELAAQVQDNVDAYSQNLPLTSAVVFGGVSINPQLSALRKGVDILVATPGRLLDLCQQGAISFSELEILVLDEADRMLDMGFIRDIKKVLALLPKTRQNLLFSATFSDEIRALAKGLVHNPVEISVSPRNTTANTVEQSVYALDKTKKSAALIQLIKSEQCQQILVFSRTKHGANRLAVNLEKAGISAAAIHGNKSQTARTRALSNFKTGDVSVLVATDIAARGIDIDQLPFVVNFDLPNVPEDYVHRIGRTGRAGASGQAVSLVSIDDIKLLHGIEKLIGKVIMRKTLDGLEPLEYLPEPTLGKGNKPANHQAKTRRTQSPNQRKHARSNDRKANPNAGNSQGKSSNSQGKSNPNPKAKPQSNSNKAGDAKKANTGNKNTPKATHKNNSRKPNSSRPRNTSANS